MIQGLALQLGQIAEQGLVSGRPHHRPRRAGRGAPDEDDVPAEARPCRGTCIAKEVVAEQLRRGEPEELQKTENKEDTSRWPPSDNRRLDRGAQGHLGAGALRAHQGARGGVRRLRDRRRRRSTGSRRPRWRRGAGEEEAGTVDLVLTGSGEQEDRRDQGRPRRHRTRPQGGEGPRRRGSEARQGGVEREEAEGLLKEIEEAGGTAEIKQRVQLLNPSRLGVRFRPCPGAC